MLARLEQHLLQPHAVGRLDVGALGDRHPRGAQALGQLVAYLLELSEAEQPRLTVALGRTIEPTHAVGGDERVAQLALEPGDLGSQGAARSALIDLDDARRDRRWSGAVLE